MTKLLMGYRLDWYGFITFKGEDLSIVGIPATNQFGYILKADIAMMPPDTALLYNHPMPSFGGDGFVSRYHEHAQSPASVGEIGFSSPPSRQPPMTSPIRTAYSGLNLSSGYTAPNGLNSSTAALGDFFPREFPRTSFSDVTIQEISLLLKQIDSDWSTVPRLYIVLRLINRTDLLNDFLSFGFTDHWFPISRGALPRKYRSTILPEILAVQNVILTKSIELERGGDGVHGHFEEGEPLPFTPVKKLGGGGYGEVHEVLSTISNKRYARKRIRRKTVFGQGLTATSEGMKQFLEEMNIMKRLSHHHIVRYVGSYTDPKHLVLLMSPVCDMDLSQFIAELDKGQHDLLRTYFGCLSAALQYLHGHAIRHRDIKPHNILIKGQDIYFTDFGLSRDYSKATGTTTSGYTPKSSRYCAPEVADHDYRNSSSDVWSLGCVFLEMSAALTGYSLSDMDKYLLSHGDSNSSYIRENQKATASFISMLKSSAQVRDNVVLSCIETMIRIDRKRRPTAKKVFDTIVGPDHLEASARRFCGRCCLDIEDSD
jgi:hypothetical protein